MKQVVMFAAVTLALAASPALAQGRGGGAGGPPAGGPAGGMGAGPPMVPPGQTSDPSSSARDIAAQRGQFGRDFADQQRMDQAQQAQFVRERAEDFKARSEQRRLEALARRDAARSGQPVGMTSREIREELKRDLEEWRNAFRVGRKDWQRIRDEILVDAGSLTPEQWADRRAQWFEQRDAWIARQVEWAQSRNGDAGSGG